jgi:hypothetical protein
MGDSARFRETLLEAIDDALLVPGEIVRSAIYDCIEKRHRIKREEIPEKVELFHKSLQQLLGGSAKVIEKLIAKSLYRKLGLNFNEHKDWTLLDYINHAKKGRPTV